MKSSKYLAIACSFTLVAGVLAFSQKVETVNGVRVVHNGKNGTWGNEPKLTLELVRTLGELETQDENLAFNLPSDIALDKSGNIYVLDSGNHRIQKFSPGGKYLATFGRRGQGPGEYVYPQSIDVDDSGFIYISDPQNQRIQVLTPEGKDRQTISMTKENPGNVRATASGRMAMAAGSAMVMFSPDEEEPKELPKLIKMLKPTGEIEKEFGEPYDYKNFLLNKTGNQAHFALDAKDNVYLAFTNQNRVEKYSAEGNLLWRADRELEYSTEAPKDKGKMDRRGGGVSIRMPQMNTCSVGIAVDGKGRTWVATLKRQLKEEERVGTNVMVSMSDGQRTMSMKPDGNVEVRKTDAYRLEVYDPEGLLLGAIPVDHFVDGIFIEQDRLFLLDRMRGAQFYEYKIVEK